MNSELKTMNSHSRREYLSPHTMGNEAKSPDESDDTSPAAKHDISTIVVKNGNTLLFELSRSKDGSWKLREPVKKKILSRREKNKRQILLEQMRRKRRNSTTLFGRLRNKHKNELRARGYV